MTIAILCIVTVNKYMCTDTAVIVIMQWKTCTTKQKMLKLIL